MKLELVRVVLLVLMSAERLGNAKFAVVLNRKIVLWDL
jgi:hypothetical protein